MSVAAPKVEPLHGDGEASFQLLFEIEHAVESKPKGVRPTPHIKSPKACEQVDAYKAAADAVVSCLCELLNEVKFSWYSILVNRRVLRAQDREASAGAKFQLDEPLPEPSPESPRDREKDRFSHGRFIEREPASPPRSEVPAHGGEEAQHSLKPSPPCARARRNAAARYPRPGAFEVTVYNPERRSHSLLYSKYHRHKLPSSEAEIWNGLLPFLLVFAGQSNDEALMNGLAAFAVQRNIVVQLTIEELKEHEGNSLLLAFLVESLRDLRSKLTTGNPEYLHSLINDVPHGLRTEDVVMAEQRLNHLLNVERKVSDALARIETGLVTSGMECLQHAVDYAQQEGLVSKVMQLGLDVLLDANSEDSSDAETDGQDSSNITHQTTDGHGRHASQKDDRSDTVSQKPCGTTKVRTPMHEAKQRHIAELEKHMSELSCSFYLDLPLLQGIYHLHHTSPNGHNHSSIVARGVVILLKYCEHQVISTM
jgi:hypothetical protein